MADYTPEQYEDAILIITGHEKWPIVQSGLFNEIQASNNNALFLENWDKVVEEKGFVRGLMYVITLREQMEAAKRQRDADV